MLVESYTNYTSFFDLPREDAGSEIHRIRDLNERTNAYRQLTCLMYICRLYPKIYSFIKKSPFRQVERAYQDMIVVRGKDLG